MKVKNIAGACLEMSQAETHPHTAKAQLTSQGGEKNKIIGFSRCVPKPIIRGILRQMQKDTLPLREAPGNPLNYGRETMVFDLPKTGAEPVRVLKLYHARYAIEQTMAEYAECQQQMQKYFPSLVVPSSLFVYEGRYTSEPCLAAVQEKIDGTCLFSGPRGAKQSDLVTFFDGTNRMLVETGVVPDLGGVGNVLVDAEGDVRIVDCGFPIDIDLIHVNEGLRSRFEWLAANAGALEEVAAYSQTA